MHPPTRSLSTCSQLFFVIITSLVNFLLHSCMRHAICGFLPSKATRSWLGEALITRTTRKNKQCNLEDVVAAGRGSPRRLGKNLGPETPSWSAECCFATIPHGIRLTTGHAIQHRTAKVLVVSICLITSSLSMREPVAALTCFLLHKGEGENAV